MRTIHVTIKGMFVQKDSKNGGVQGEGNATQLHVTFDETWQGYGKRIIWRDAQGENPVSVVLIAAADAAAAGTADTLTYDTPIPAEALALPGWCSFTAEGFQDADDGGGTPASAVFSVRDVLQVMENDSTYSPAEPTPSEAQQILAAIAKNEAAVGAYAKEAKSWAVGGTGSREGEDTDNAMYYAQQAEDSRNAASESAESATTSAGSASNSAAAAAGSAAAAAGSASDAAGSAVLSRSWAVGGTGSRPGEDTDNARYWAAKAQAEADRATVPAAEGAYNVILVDRATGAPYALMVEDGVLKLLGMKEGSYDPTEVMLVDGVTGIPYTLTVESGTLKMEEC